MFSSYFSYAIMQMTLGPTDKPSVHLISASFDAFSTSKPQQKLSKHQTQPRDFLLNFFPAETAEGSLSTHKKQTQTKKK